MIISIYRYCIHYIHTLYIHQVCFISLINPSTSRPQGFGLWDGTEPKKNTGWTKRPSGHTEPYSKVTEVGRVTLSICSTGSTHAIPRSATSLCGVGTSEGWSSLIFFWRDVLLLMEEIHLASWYFKISHVYNHVSYFSLSVGSLPSTAWTSIGLAMFNACFSVSPSRRPKSGPDKKQRLDELRRQCHLAPTKVLDGCRTFFLRSEYST